MKKTMHLLKFTIIILLLTGPCIAFSGTECRIEGTVSMLGTRHSFVGKVYLIGQTTCGIIGPVYEPMGSVSVTAEDNGAFVLPIPSGCRDNFIVKAVINEDEELSDSYLPTYYGNAFEMGSALIIQNPCRLPCIAVMPPPEFCYKAQADIQLIRNISEAEFRIPEVDPIPFPKDSAEDDEGDFQIPDLDPKPLPENGADFEVPDLQPQPLPEDGTNGEDLFPSGDQEAERATSGLSDLSEEEWNDALQIFPQPANSQVSLSFSSLLSVKHICIRNLEGRILKEIVPRDEHITIDLSTFQPGMYLLSIVTDTTQLSRPLVIK